MRRIAQNLYRSVLLATASLDPSRLKVPHKLRKDFNKKQQKFTEKDQQVPRCKAVQKTLDLSESLFRRNQYVQYAQWTDQHVHLQSHRGQQIKVVWKIGALNKTITSGRYCKASLVLLQQSPLKIYPQMYFHTSLLGLLPPTKINSSWLHIYS